MISAALKKFADEAKCDMVITTGGTGIAARDVTPEATRPVLEKELPGFGEAMRMQSLAKVKTAILSRALAGTRGTTLIINLPGKPAAVRECLEILRRPSGKDWRICAEKIRTRKNNGPIWTKN